MSALYCNEPKQDNCIDTNGSDLDPKVRLIDAPVFGRHKRVSVRK